MKTIYLASKSPRRKELLRQIGVPFELLPLREFPVDRRDVDESPLPGEAPVDYVRRIARIKAEAAGRIMTSRRLPQRLVLAADTTVTLDGEIFGKPADAADAARMLKRFSAATHQVLTAVAVSDGREMKESLSVSEVTFRKLTDAEIQTYVAGGEPLDKAGAYAIQGKAAVFVSHLAGSFSGVVGLPIAETWQLLREFDPS
ncbi:MAG: septum formation inhibitor Maf [Betaproteobacteria bacterium]|nr:septum formation inhibitor Maf [Betaproteobacteria bacterium]